MNRLKRFKWFLNYFGWFKVPMIGYLKPKICLLNDEEIIVRLRLNRRSKNHLNSMYFGALAVGADIAGGLPAFYHADKLGYKMSMAFKSFEAQFLKRPTSDVYFVLKSGERIRMMIEASKNQQERINQKLEIIAYTHYYEPDQQEAVAHFNLELSVKVLT